MGDRDLMLQTLQTYMMLEHSPSTKSFSMHELTQSWLRNNFKASEQMFLGIFARQMLLEAISVRNWGNVYMHRLIRQNLRSCEIEIMIAFLKFNPRSLSQSSLSTFSLQGIHQSFRCPSDY